jgi:hypothetical protein
VIGRFIAKTVGFISHPNGPTLWRPAERSGHARQENSKAGLG